MSDNRPLPAVNPPPIPFDNGITDIPDIQDSPDNGPYVYPPPPGPDPTGDYEYLLVPRPTPVLPNMPFYLAFTVFQQVEYDMRLRNVYADRIDLIDGSRVYRVLLQYMWRFDHDADGAYFGRQPNIIRYVVDDPSIGKATLNEWTPV